MLKDIVEVRALPNHRLWLRFEDDVKGELDFKSLVDFKGMFAPLSNQHEFAKVSVNEELGVVCWPNGADLDLEVLYSLVTKKPISLRKPSLHQVPVKGGHDHA